MFERPILTILVWGLLLEILGLIYFSVQSYKFEFQYMLILFLFNLTSFILVLLSLLRRSKLRRR